MMNNQVDSLLTLAAPFGNSSRSFKVSKQADVSLAASKDSNWHELRMLRPD
jgi:hypothetical protein